MDGVDEEQLLAQLRTETDGKAVKRPTSALLYGQGKSPAEIEQLFGFIFTRVTTSPDAVYQFNTAV